jgi:hypothetical membrane protein
MAANRGTLTGIPGWTLVSAALSPVLLTVGWLVADAVQPPSYSPMRQTVSILAGHTGTDSWIMTWAMLLTGGTYLVTAVGLANIWLPARMLLAIAGLCSIGIATAPVPLTGATPVHLAWTTLGAGTIAIWPAVVAWRAPPQLAALTGRRTLIVTTVFLAMTAWVLYEIWFGHDLGLAERLSASIQSAWPLVVAVVWRRAAGASEAVAAVPASLVWRAPDAGAHESYSPAKYGSQGSQRR